MKYQHFCIGGASRENVSQDHMRRAKPLTHLCTRVVHVRLNLLDTVDTLTVPTYIYVTGPEDPFSPVCHFLYATNTYAEICEKGP